MADGKARVGNRSIPAVLVCLLPALTAPATAGDSFDYRSRVGVVFIGAENTGCLTIHNPDLRPETRFSVLFVHESGDFPESDLRVGEVREAAGAACEPAGAGPEDSSYRVTIGEGKMVEGMVYLAILVPPESFTASGERARVDLDGDGTPESFRLCASNEGLHFTVWSGKPLEGARRWHHYHYLGYDLEPTCVEADYSENPD